MSKKEKRLRAFIDKLLDSVVESTVNGKKVPAEVDRAYVKVCRGLERLGYAI